MGAVMRLIPWPTEMPGAVGTVRVPIRTINRGQGSNAPANEPKYDDGSARGPAARARRTAPEAISHGCGVVASLPVKQARSNHDRVSAARGSGRVSWHHTNERD